MYAAQFAQSREAPGHSPLNVRLHAQISIEEDAEVADAGRRQNKVFTDPQRSTRQLMLSMCGRTREQISLAGVELQTVRPHPRRDVIQTGRQTQLKVGDGRRSA